MNQLFESFLDFHKKHRVATHVLFWSMMLLWGSLHEFFISNKHEFTFLETLLIDFLNNFAKIPTAYFVVYYLYPRAFEQKKYLSSVLFFIVGSYLIYIMAYMIKIKLFPFIGIVFEEANPIKSLLTDPSHFYQFVFFKNIGGGAGILLIKLLLNRTEVQKKSLTLEKQKSEIELKLLKTQLNPHFLFNTLNNIYTLSLLNSPKTSESIARLSEILDYILYRCNAKTVPILGEIQLIENYIALEKLRYDERLKVNFSKQIEQNVEIAPLILLTFVENAFKHGAGEDAGSPEIKIELKVNGEEINFKIENTCKITEKVQKSEDSGIGLKNLRQQLDLIYAEKYQLEIQQTDNRFEVILTIKKRG